MNGISTALRAALLVAAAAGPVAAGPTGDPAQSGMVDLAGIRAAIELQLEAFGRGDFAEAFAYASPGIRARFMTVENFAEMVRGGFPMVHRSLGHSFGALTPEGPRLRQAVVLTDAAGRVWVADYHMVLADGVWCVDGVTLRPAVEAGA